ncbi:unnamed protein product [Symbiodinium natans]|uniref:EF-hand domain-containing protein n=1 Tax=Symbiodinium natans TaxID=878477 RepID=A0A812LJ91_9DINO|nr:unnamed protein product [Symbiodinium natans]
MAAFHDPPGFPAGHEPELGRPDDCASHDAWTSHQVRALQAGDLPQIPLASRLEKHWANFAPKPRPANMKCKGASQQHGSEETSQLRGSEDWVHRLLASFAESQICPPPWNRARTDSAADGIVSSEEAGGDPLQAGTTCEQTEQRSSRPLDAEVNVQDRRPGKFHDAARNAAWSPRCHFGNAKALNSLDELKTHADGDGSLSFEKMQAIAMEQADCDKSDADDEVVALSDALQESKAEDMIKSYDDGDGVLSRDELKKLQAQNSKLAEVDFEKLDTDGDGVVSKDELAAALDWDTMQEPKEEDAFQTTVALQSAVVLSQQSRELFESRRTASQRKEKRKAKRKEASLAEQTRQPTATALGDGEDRMGASSEDQHSQKEADRNIAADDAHGEVHTTADAQLEASFKARSSSVQEAAPSPEAVLGDPLKPGIVKEARESHGDVPVQNDQNGGTDPAETPQAANGCEPNRTSKGKRRSQGAKDPEDLNSPNLPFETF